MKLPVYLASQLYQLITLLYKNDTPFVYVAIGDSAAEGIGASSPERSYTGILYATIKRNQKNAIYHNFGKRGAPVQEIIETQLEKTIALQPNLITISVGANDLRVKTRPSVFAKRLEFLLSELKNKTTAEIVINTIPDFSHTPRITRGLKNVTRVAIKHFNKILTQIAEKENVIVIDIFEQGTYYGRHFPEAIANDGFHPNDIGYALWANLIINHAKHIFSPSTIK